MSAQAYARLLGMKHIRQRSAHIIYIYIVYMYHTIPFLWNKASHHHLNIFHFKTKKHLLGEIPQYEY